MPAADLLKSAVPAWAKRRHERWQTDRFLRTANDLNARYAERAGLEVKRGPLAGLRYPPELLQDSGDAVAKLVGSYEEEIYPALQEWIDAGVERVVDIGAAEGFYAAGLAHASPATTVIAFDIDPVAREKCARLAAHNGVAERVDLRTEATHATLGALPAQGTALLSDCEGCELDLLDPEKVPPMRSWPIVVELHDFIDPSITRTITERFLPTHDVELVEGRTRDGAELPELEGFTAEERELALSERRPGPMRWAVLRPRG